MRFVAVICVSFIAAQVQFLRQAKTEEKAEVSSHEEMEPQWKAAKKARWPPKNFV